MGGEAIIAAVLGALLGGGGMRFLARLSGPDRDGRIARYYQRVIKHLTEENEELRRRVRGLEDRVEELRGLERRVAELERGQEA